MTIKKRKTSKLIAGIAFLIFFLPFHKSTVAQPFDYGIEVGVGAYNEKWTSDIFPLTGWGKDKAGLTVSIFGALKHSSNFSTKLELGYMNKGFINDLSWEYPDGSVVTPYSFRTDLKTFKLSLGERITFLASSFRPFFDVGFNVQYVPESEIGNRPMVFMDKDAVPKMFYDYKWNTITFNGTVGIGLIYKQLVYIKLEYNHAFTKLLDDNGVEVIDRAFVGSVGVNINELVKLF
ncbi:MAG: hypothetical protein M0Q90_03210 [Bacteroidales bacterium]|nr:hypothetical protein [Bacteroidales bacterium]